MKKSQRKVGAVFSTLSIFLSSAVGLLFTPFLIKSLGTVEYGLYQLLTATIGYLALLDFGLGSTVTQFVLRGEQSKNEEVSVNSVITMCIKIYAAIAGTVFVLTIVSSRFLTAFYPATIDATNVSYAQKLFLIMGTTTAITLFTNAFSGVESAYEQYIVTKGVRFFQQLIRVILLTVLFLLGMKAMAIVLVDFFLALFLLIFDMVYCKAVLKIRFFRGEWNHALFRRIFVFSIFVFMQIVVAQVNNSVDRTLLGRYGSLEMVGLYAVSMTFYGLFNGFGGIIMSVSIPQVTNLVFSGKSDEEITDACATFSRYQFVLLMFLLGGFILYGQQFIACWTQEYSAYYVWSIALLVNLPQILEFIENPIFYVMKAKEMQGGRSVILICVAAANVVLSYFLLKWFPVYGCAIGTFVTFIIGNNILANIYYHKRIGIIIPRYFRKTLKGLLPAWISAMLIGLGIAFIPLSGWIGLIVKGVLYTFVYLALMMLLGLKKDEQEAMKSMLLRFGKKGDVS